MSSNIQRLGIYHTSSDIHHLYIYIIRKNSTEPVQCARRHVCGSVHTTQRAHKCHASRNHGTSECERAHSLTHYHRTIIIHFDSFGNLCCGGCRHHLAFLYMYYMLLSDLMAKKENMKEWKSPPRRTNQNHSRIPGAISAPCGIIYNMYIWMKWLNTDADRLLGIIVAPCFVKMANFLLNCWIGLLPALRTETQRVKHATINLNASLLMYEFVCVFLSQSPNCNDALYVLPASTTRVRLACCDRCDAHNTHISAH